MTLFDCRWIPSSTRFVVAGTQTKGHGILRVYTMSDRDGLKQLVNIERKRHPFKCLTFGATNLADRQPATGDFDGNINVWDLENKIPVWSVKGHSSIVNAIDGVGGEAMSSSSDVGTPEIVSGSRDGSVKVWDIRIKEKPVACMEPVEGGPRRDCWSVAFGTSLNPTDRMVAAGFDNGDVKIFDLRTMTLHWETRVHNGVCSVAFDRSDAPMSKLSATCLKGRVHVWDLTSDVKERYTEWTGNVESNHTIWGGRFLHQNKDVLVTISGSGSVALWKYNHLETIHNKTNKEDNPQGKSGKLEKVLDCQIAEQPITGFDWSPDKLGLAVATAFDQKVRLLAFTQLNNL